MRKFFSLPGRRAIKRIIIYLLSGLLLALALVVSAGFLHIRAEGSNALRNARNVQLAMRILSIQYYGEDKTLFLPEEENGMSRETAKELAELSGAEGEIILISWVEESGQPERFVYREGEFLVDYEYDRTLEKPSWTVYRMKKLIDFTNG